MLVICERTLNLPAITTDSISLHFSVDYDMADLASIVVPMPAAKPELKIHV